MVRVKYIRLIIRTLLFLISVVPASMLGQQTSRYQGPMKVGPYQGTADYTYKVIQGDTLLDGPFLLERSSLDELLQSKDSTFSFSGSFTDNYPDDFWRFEFGAFTYERESRVVDYQYRISVSGIQEEASGKFNSGRPSGRWDYLIQKIESSKAQETLFHSQFDFDRGVPQGNFRIESEEGTLVGRFLRDGFAHDQWALYYLQEIGASEQWNFLEGVLQNIQVTRNGQTRVWEFFGNRIPEERVLKLDARYLKALTLYLPVSDSTSLLDLGIFRALAKNARLYQKIDGIIGELGEGDFKPELKVKLPYFPLDSLERRQLDTLVGDVEKARDLADDLLNDTQLNLLKLSDDQAMFLYNSVQALSKTFLLPLEVVEMNYKEGLLEFIPRAEFILHVWPYDRPSPTISVKMGESETSFRSFTGPGGKNLDFDGVSLTQVSEMGRYLLNSLDSIQTTLSDKLSRNKRQQDLIALEEKLIVQDRRLIELLDSLDSTVDRDIQKAFQSIREVAEKELSTYASLEDTGNKLLEARKLTACLSQLEHLTRVVSKFPEQQARITEAYKERVWNPFMAVLMDEEVKKRITNAYRRVLAPYFLKKIQANLNCSNAAEFAPMILSLHQRMLELREEDTAKLERKLKREDDPLEILELFNVEKNILKDR